MLALASSVTRQVVAVELEHPRPPASEVHVTLLAPAPGAPVSTTVESKGNAAVHVPGHVMPAGELATVPLPDTATVRLACVQVPVPTPAAETKAVPKT